MKKLFTTILFFTLFILSSLQAHDNTFGFSFNPARIGLSGSDSTLDTYSGTLSYFNHVDNTEIAIPWFYEKDTYEFDPYSSFRIPETLINIDLQYRQYIDEDRSVEGIFYGGFARYSYLHGEAYKKPHIATQHKFGLGLVTGFQITTFNIADLDIYWGANLSLGFYLNKDTDIFESGKTLYMDDDYYILDIELFKIGITF